MAQIGEPIIDNFQLNNGQTTEYFADSGECWKVVLVYAKAISGGGEANSLLAVAPANGQEEAQNDGTITNDPSTPPIGADTGSEDTLQPVLITDTNGLYIGADGVDMTVFINAVRIS